jgi:hypothetical protein
LLDEATVLETKSGESGIDADSPETTEVVLLVFAVSKRVELSMINSLTSHSLFL